MCEMCSVGQDSGDCQCARIAELESELSSARKELEKLREETRWIPVSDGIPDKYERVLLFDPTIPKFPRTNTHIVIGYFRGFDDICSPWHSPDGGRGPTHWRRFNPPDVAVREAE